VFSSATPRPLNTRCEASLLPFTSHSLSLSLSLPPRWNHSESFRLGHTNYGGILLSRLMRTTISVTTTTDDDDRRQTTTTKTTPTDDRRQTTEITTPTTETLTLTLITIIHPSSNSSHVRPELVLSPRTAGASRG
jgi:hypothetical protein